MNDQNNKHSQKAPHTRSLLETSAIIVGYAMSRLDRAYLGVRRLKSWKAAFEDAGRRLGVAPASLKNLRDEFDPIHGNARRGWTNRPMRDNRQRVMGQLCDVSDAALVEMIARILSHDGEAIEEVVEPLSKPSERVHNVAERLRTGRLAESFFLENSEVIAGISGRALLDHRDLARGYDFGVRDRERVAIEVKGIKQAKGAILFTDREWCEARARRTDYLLVVVGNIEAKPTAKLFADPVSTIMAECKYQTSIAATWRATVAVA